MKSHKLKIHLQYININKMQRNIDSLLKCTMDQLWITCRFRHHDTRQRMHLLLTSLPLRKKSHSTKLTISRGLAESDTIKTWKRQKKWEGYDSKLVISRYEELMMVFWRFLWISCVRSIRDNFCGTVYRRHKRWFIYVLQGSCIKPFLWFVSPQYLSGLKIHQNLPGGNFLSNVMDMVLAPRPEPGDFPKHFDHTKGYGTATHAESTGGDLHWREGWLGKNGSARVSWAMVSYAFNAQMDGWMIVL